MRASVKYILAALVLVALSCKGQTPEQKKMMKDMMEDMEKKGMEAQRQYDSIMNTPEMKKIAEQNKAFEAQAKIDRDKRAAERKENSEKTVSPKNDLEDYIISSGNAKKFDNWSFGEADIVMAGLTGYQNDPGNKKKIGTVKADGSFDMQLPAKIATYSTIKENRWLSCGYFGDKGNIDYSNSNTGVMIGYISIEINDQLIGRLYMATAIELIDGWNPMQYHYHDIPGYRLEWFYAGGETSANGRCVKENRYGEGRDFDITTVYDAQLKPGWNLVKREFDGPRIFVDWGDGENNKHSYYKEEKISVVNELPGDAKWVFYDQTY
ncbi:hypothetical protein [uncultured Eudoraea sp.]|uniref:hypothetical protein n=1 Tax=uncultured Eudoraea sp. TaxID=1035614 RepID=UPI0026398054|nr:hypothetical protein [uncultured Eudoraea sp.]